MPHKLKILAVVLVVSLTIYWSILYLAIPYRLREAIRTDDFETFSRLLTIERANEPHHLSIDITLYLIHIACSDARPEFVRLLIERGADVHARDNRGRTGIFHAIGGSGDVTTKIVILDMLYKKDPTTLNDHDSSGGTVLHEAAQLARVGLDVRIFEELVRLGANIHSENEEGKTPLNLYREEYTEFGLKMDPAIDVLLRGDQKPPEGN